jgi:hypothetical protein
LNHFIIICLLFLLFLRFPWWIYLITHLFSFLYLSPIFLCYYYQFILTFLFLFIAIDHYLLFIIIYLYFLYFLLIFWYFFFLLLLFHFILHLLWFIRFYLLIYHYWLYISCNFFAQLWCRCRNFILLWRLFFNVFFFYLKCITFEFAQNRFFVLYLLNLALGFLLFNLLNRLLFFGFISKLS